MTDSHPSMPLNGGLGTPLPVLVIEDEKFLLSYFQSALQRGGLKSVGATTGGEALDLLERGHFAAVISDLRLPGGVDGAQIFDWVCRNRPQLARRFLFITGDLQSSYALEVRERTGAIFLQKPFRVAQLLETVKAILSPGETVHA
jgi:DNA-binding NtrC family response regulator